MSELLRIDEEYRNWIQELGKRYRISQIKASIRVNNVMLMYYWSVGKDIAERHAISKWGNKFFQNMSMDLADIIPNVKGFSPTNLRYMMRFYELFKDITIVPQVGEQLLENSENQNISQHEEHNEKELKDALMNNVQNFLMELGKGFAFVGREYRIQIGNTEQYIDMLFYNIKRHCYVVVEVKVVEFEPGFISQTATYVSAVNHMLKGNGDTQTVVKFGSCLFFGSKLLIHIIFTAVLHNHGFSLYILWIS